MSGSGERGVDGAKVNTVWQTDSLLQQAGVLTGVAMLLGKRKGKQLPSLIMMALQA